MTHQPPVPEGSTSPYPLQPAPIPEAVKQRAAQAEAARAAEAVNTGPSQATVLGIGAAVALGAAAAVSGLFFARRRSAAPTPTKKRAAGKSKASPKRKASATRH